MARGAKGARLSGAKVGSRYNSTDAEMEAIASVADASGHGMSDEAEARLTSAYERTGKKAPKAYAKGGKYNVQDLVE